MLNKYYSCSILLLFFLYVQSTLGNDALQEFLKDLHPVELNTHNIKTNNKTKRENTPGFKGLVYI